MRKMLVPSIAILVLAATPVGAQTAEPTPPCAASEQYAPLGITGKQASFAPSPIPSVGHDLPSLVGQPSPYHEESVTRFRYRIDVSGSTTKPLANQGTVNLTLSWDNDTEFDLYVYDVTDNLLGKSTKFNPQVGSGESVSLPETAHCTDLRIDVVNYLGLPTSALVLDAKLTGLKP